MARQRGAELDARIPHIVGNNGERIPVFPKKPKVEPAEAAKIAQERANEAKRLHTIRLAVAGEAMKSIRAANPTLHPERPAPQE